MRNQSELRLEKKKRKKNGGKILKEKVEKKRHRNMYAELDGFLGGRGLEQKIRQK